MTAIAVHRRPFDAFLSHRHVDRVLVDRLYSLLTEKAGLSIWYDAYQMGGGDSIRTVLQRGVEQSRGMLVVGSAEAVESNWVEDELAIAEVERNDSREFRVIPLRISGADVDRFVKGLSWIDLPEPELTEETLFAILRSFYPGERLPEPENSRDVYVSASWDSEEDQSWRGVSTELVSSGFRLVGDAKNQATFDLARIEDIINSCGAFVAVVPYRDGVEANSREGPYKYILSEIDLARSLGLPMLVIADPRVHRTDGDDSTWLRMATDDAECPLDVARSIQNLWGLWQRPSAPHYVFLALDLESEAAAKRSSVRKLLERVTGMPTVIGSDITEPPLQDSIIRTIADARLVVADITDSRNEERDAKRFNLDVCIEAAIAHQAGRHLQLVAQGEQRSPPFMLRLNQMPTYSDGVELVALMHGTALRHRRRIINAEL